MIKQAHRPIAPLPNILASLLCLSQPQTSSSSLFNVIFLLEHSCKPSFPHEPLSQTQTSSTSSAVYLKKDFFWKSKLHSTQTFFLYTLFSTLREARKGFPNHFFFTSHYPLFACCLSKELIDFSFHKTRMFMETNQS